MQTDGFIVDFAKCGLSAEHPASEADLLSVGKCLVECLDRGFAYLTNTGIELDKVRKALDYTDQFFALPLETKEEYRFGSNISWNGYGKMRTEWLGKDYGQSKDDKETYFYRIFNDKQSSRVSPDKEVPGFSKAMAEAAGPFPVLSKIVLHCIALATGHESDVFDGYLKGLCEGAPVENTTTLKMVCHPPIEDDTDLTDVVRCGRHVDGGFITLNVTDSTGGLQIQQKDGSWFDVPHIPGAIVIFPGKVLEILLAGKMTATVHQVLVTSREMARRKRRGFIVFVPGDEGSVYKPLDGSAEYEPVSVGDISDYYESRVSTQP